MGRALEEVRARLLDRYGELTPAIRSASTRDAVALLMRIAEVMQPAVTWEVGAFQASFSRRAAKVLPQARLIALEANPYVHRHFAPELAAEWPAVEYLNVAATYEEREVTFRVQTYKSGRVLKPVRGDNSLMLRHQRGVEYEEVTVPGTRVDTLAAALGVTGVPSVMWVDVEGAQREVIAGARETMRAAQAMLIEVETRPFWEGQLLEPEVDEQLSWLGLTPVFMDFEYGTQHNVLYVAEHLAAPSSPVAELIEEARQ